MPGLNYVREREHVSYSMDHHHSRSHLLINSINLEASDIQRSASMASLADFGFTEEEMKELDSDSDRSIKSVTGSDRPMTVEEARKAQTPIHWVSQAEEDEEEKEAREMEERIRRELMSDLDASKKREQAIKEAEKEKKKCQDEEERQRLAKEEEKREQQRMQEEKRK